MTYQPQHETTISPYPVGQPPFVFGATCACGWLWMPNSVASSNTRRTEPMNTTKIACIICGYAIRSTGIDLWQHEDESNQNHGAAPSAHAVLEQTRIDRDQALAELAVARGSRDEWKREAERMRLQFAVETKRVGILADCIKAGGYHSPEGFHAQPGHGKSCRECNALREALGPLAVEAQS